MKVRRDFGARLHRLLAVDPNRWWYVPDLVNILCRWGGWGGTYVALSNLEEIGCVEARWVPQGEGRRPRRQYRLATNDLSCHITGPHDQCVSSVGARNAR